MIISGWFPLAAFLTELLAHASKAAIEDVAKSGVGEVGKRMFDPRVLRPKPLLELRVHFIALHEATQALATETHSGALSECYHKLRAQWLELFAPAQTVLHNLDPMALSALDIYSQKMGSLLGRELKVTEKTLNEALEAEKTEIEYDTESHLCTLCLQIVRNWSDSKTIAGGLGELAVALQNTIAKLDTFIGATWTVKELA